MTAPIKVPADLLDADMLYQRDAVMHEGMPSSEPLSDGSRRILHALLSASDGEVVAADAEAGADAPGAAVASLVVHRAVADLEPARIVLVGEEAAVGAVPPEWFHICATTPGERFHLSDFLAKAARYLNRDPATLDLRTARMGLRGRLDRVNSARMILLNVVASGGEQTAVGLQVDRLAQLCDLGEDYEERLLAASRSLKRTDRALDAIRAHEFWLAVHTLECLWLDAAACKGEAPSEGLRLFEQVRPGELAGLSSDADAPIDLLCVTGAEAVDGEEVSGLVARSQRVLVIGDERACVPGSALAAGLAACRWDFSAAAGAR